MLPASALLHLRQPSLLGMISRLGPDSIHHRHVRQMLVAPPASLLPARQSWFLQLRALCRQYKLPDPLYKLANPTTRKSGRKKLNFNYLSTQPTSLPPISFSFPCLKYVFMYPFAYLDVVLELSV